ncbi:MAG: polysaccharide deacetylase family protein [Aquamicrobium sp.]|nr:polysaccharide deacetylase family protein [Aquamicrobium sp.]
MNARPIILAEGANHDLPSRIDRAAALWLRRHPMPVTVDRPVVSFTFDDVPDSAIINGARILEQQGCRGTFYLAGGLAGGTFGPYNFFVPSDVPYLLDRGHEVGCHTFSHPVVQTLDARRLAEEFDRNRQWLTAVDPRAEPVSFAYPYGAVGFSQKAQTARRFANSRGVRHGLNTGTADRAQLLAVQLYDCRLDEKRLDEIIGEAVRSKAWLVFYTHDVQEGPSEHGCSPRLLSQAVQRVLAAGCTVAPMREAMALVGGAEKSHR